MPTAEQAIKDKERLKLYENYLSDIFENIKWNNRIILAKLSLEWIVGFILKTPYDQGCELLCRIPQNFLNSWKIIYENLHPC